MLSNKKEKKDRYTAPILLCGVHRSKYEIRRPLSQDWIRHPQLI